MFGLTRPKLPITDERRKWIDQSFERLATMLGANRLFEADVVLPTPEFFPDRYERSEEALQAMLNRIARRMGLDPADIDVTLFASSDHLTNSLVPFYSSRGSGAAGLYHHDPSVRARIEIDEFQMKDPMTLVAVIAHELGHIVLLRPGLVDRAETHMEPLTDLLTVFLGFGIFTANAAFRFEQHQDGRSQGWSVQRQGYLSEEEFGYALARFAYERGETRPTWVSFLSTNVKTFTKRSVAWLAANHGPQVLKHLKRD